jgi:peptide/nickel transport system substrate-binding protein
MEHSPNERWVFEANPAFPASLGGRPFVDRYVYRIIPEQTTLLAELLTGNVDVYIAPSADQAQSIIDNPSTELLAYTFKNYVFVGWNSRRPQLADARVRRALTMGTDRETIVASILRGYGQVAHGSVPPFHWAYDPAAIDRVEYDPAGARALLDEAGWRDRDGDGVRESADGTRLAISIKYNPNLQRQQMTEIMQSQLAAIGVEVRPMGVEYTTLIQQITSSARDFDGVMIGWNVEFKLDDTDLFHSERIDQPYAWSGTKNPEIDRLLEAISRTADREEAKALWREYQNVLAQEQPYTFFYTQSRLDGVNRRVQGVVMDVRGEWVNLKDWYLDPASR